MMLACSTMPMYGAHASNPMVVRHGKIYTVTLLVKTTVTRIRFQITCLLMTVDVSMSRLALAEKPPRNHKYCVKPKSDGVGTPRFGLLRVLPARHDAHGLAHCV